MPQGVLIYDISSHVLKVFENTVYFECEWKYEAISYPSGAKKRPVGQKNDEHLNIFLFVFWQSALEHNSNIQNNTLRIKTKNVLAFITKTSLYDEKHKKTAQTDFVHWVSIN